MPIDITRTNVNLGKVAYQWTINEYEQYERPRSWYFTMGIIGLAMLVYAIIAANYLFALIIVLFGIILFLFDNQTPMAVPFALTATGIVLGKKYYRYSEIKNFWVIYNPPEVKNLYFSLDNLIRHRLQIPLMDYDPRPIKDYLKQYLTEDYEQEDEPMGDRLTRTMRLH